MMAKDTVVMILLLLFLGFLVVDLLRHCHSGISHLFQKIFFGQVLREKEKSTLMGSTYFLFAILLTILLFPKSIAIISILILILSDTAGALVGKAIGRVPIFGKTLEGSLAFFITALFIVWLYPQLNRLWGSVAALGATVIEVLPIKLDDNLSIPLVAGAIMSFAGG
jgi:dolichol kinase